MKQSNKEKSNSKQKVSLKKTNNNNNNNKNNNNPFYPIKYFCFNEVKKIVNNKNKKSPLQNKTNEKLQPNKKNESTRKEQEDDYCKNTYIKRLNIPHNISSIILRKRNLFLNKIDINMNNNHCVNNSYDERYKTVNKFGLYTKKNFCGANMAIPVPGALNFGLKKSKFSKKNKKKKKSARNKMKLSNNNNNYLDIHDITNMNGNNTIYKSNNINESNNTITSNTITSKTITNNTMSNYTMSNITPNSYYNKTNNTNNTNSNIIDNNMQNNNNIKDYAQANKNDKSNNIKVIRNKGRNNNNNNDKEIKKKNIKNIKKKNKENKENTVFIRRIILEEKFTIDSKGDKKTIYIKKISPIMQVKDTVINSADKRLSKNKKIIKNNSNRGNTKKKNYNNKKDNTFINHNDINLNFNVCSFQKINVSDNINNISKDKHEQFLSKLESFDDDNNDNNLIINSDNNENDLNDTILKNYKNFLNIQDGHKIIYQKPNTVLYKTENNHKSYQSLLSNPSKRYLIQSGGKSNCEKQKSKINQKILNNIKKNSTNDFENNKIPLNYIIANPRFLKNKMVHRKNNSNYVLNKNVEKDEKYQSNCDCIAQYEEIDENTINSEYKRSLSFIGKTPIYNIIKKFKDNKKIPLKDTININSNNKNNHTIDALFSSKINEYSRFSPANTSSITCKNKTKVNSVNNSKLIQKMNNIKKLNNILDDSIEKERKSHSLGKLKMQNYYNSNDIKVFINYLKSNMFNNNSERNKSHRNFLIKKYQKYNLNDLINNRNKKKDTKKVNCNNMVYFKNKAKKK